MRIAPRILVALASLLFVACGDDDGIPDDTCRSNADCTAPTLICSGERCVQCVRDEDCGADQICFSSICVPDDTEICTSDADCPAERPTCMLSAGLEGVCIAGCATDDQCPDGDACIEGSCVECSADAGSRLPTESCACDSDCAGPGAVCAEGICEGDCEQTGCPAGLVCGGDPGQCVVCEADSRAEGAACLCDDECAGGLACIGGLCGEPCDFDETCGANECGHELFVPASCREPDSACFGGGSGGLGDECTCNADCDFGAPFCMGFFAGGARGFVCSQVCGAESPCPTGFQCCGASGELHCISEALAGATGATCL